MAQPNVSGNPLAAGSLATFMVTSLPRDVSPQIKNPYEAIALAVHAGMVAVGFKIKGLGEEHRIGTLMLLSILQSQRAHIIQKFHPMPANHSLYPQNGIPQIIPMPSATHIRNLPWN